MKEKIKLIEEILYNILIGYWSLFSFLLTYAFIVDDDDGVGTYLAVATIVTYLFLLIPNNIIFLKNRNKKEKIFIIIGLIAGIILSIFFHGIQRTLNPLGILFLILLNILFLCLNKKSEILYIFLLLILNLVLIYMII